MRKLFDDDKGMLYHASLHLGLFSIYLNNLELAQCNMNYPPQKRFKMAELALNHKVRKIDGAIFLSNRR